MVCLVSMEDLASLDCRVYLDQSEWLDDLETPVLMENLAHKAIRYTIR